MRERYEVVRGEDRNRSQRVAIHIDSKGGELCKSSVYSALSIDLPIRRPENRPPVRSITGSSDEIENMKITLHHKARRMSHKIRRNAKL